MAEPISPHDQELAVAADEDDSPDLEVGARALWAWVLFGYGGGGNAREIWDGPAGGIARLTGVAVESMRNALLRSLAGDIPSNGTSKWRDSDTSRREAALWIIVSAVESRRVHM